MAGKSYARKVMSLFFVFYEFPLRGKSAPRVNFPFCDEK